LSSIRILTIRFAQEVVAVDNFPLELAEGEFISTVGPSGCGKRSVVNQSDIERNS
jgi:ABC-type Fe3+/spermidine/putrescine transport system ATPase subunit